MGTVEIISPETPREQLACRLYETMQRLAPDASAAVPWEHLTTWHRDLYLNCIDALVDDVDLFCRAFDLADHDVIKRGLEKGENPRSPNR